MSDVSAPFSPYGGSLGRKVVSEVAQIALMVFESSSVTVHILWKAFASFTSPVCLSKSVTTTLKSCFTETSPSLLFLMVKELGSSLEADLRIVRLEGKLRSLCSIRVPSSGLRLCSTFCLNRSNTVSKFLLLKPNKRVRLLSLTVKTSQFNS